MASNTTAEIILFTINAAIKLGRNIQRAYANSLKSKKIVLPLPDFKGDITETTIEVFFEEKGKRFLGQIDRLDELHAKAQNFNLTKEEKKEYEEYYMTLFQVVNGFVEEIDSDDITFLLKVRQWEKGKTPLTSPLQYIAGTLIELGIDYFNYIPGAVNLESSYGKALKSFLEGLDKISFTSENNLKLFVTQEFAPQMFVASIESLGELSTEISSNTQFQDFLQVASGTMAEDLYVRFEHMPTDAATDHTARWGQVVFRSLVKNTGEYLFTSSSDIFGTTDSTTKFIESTGLAVLDAILDDQTGAVKMNQAFQPSGIDKILRAAINVFAEHPELLSKTDGIQNIIADVSKSLADNGIVRPDLMPEVIRLILEKTGGNLQSLWNLHEADAKNMLVLVVESFMTSLAAKPDEGQWKPQFTNSQLLDMLDFITDEVVARPKWMLQLEGNQPILAEVLDSTFSVMDLLPEEERLKPGVAELLVRMSMRTAATSPTVLDKLEYGDNANEATVIHEALDTLFSFLFPKNQPSRAQAEGVFEDSVEYVLNDIIAANPNKQGLQAVRALCNPNNGLDFSTGFHQLEADQIVRPTLSLAYQQNTFSPDLDNQFVNQTIAAVTQVCHQFGLGHTRLIAGLQELVLDKTEKNLHLLQDMGGEQQEHLLVTVLKQVLPLVNLPAHPRLWRPRFNIQQIIALCDDLMETVIEDPAWVFDSRHQQPLLGLTLNTSFKAFEKIPKNQRPNIDTLLAIIHQNIEVVYQNPDLLQKMDDKEPAQTNSILAQTLLALFGAVYPPRKQPLLKRNQIALELQQYLFYEVIVPEPTAQGLLLVRMLVSPHSGVSLKDGFDPSEADELILSFKDVFAETGTVEAESDNTTALFTGIALIFKELNIEDPTYLNTLSQQLEQRNQRLANSVTPIQLNRGIKEIVSSINKHRLNTNWNYPNSGGALAVFTARILDEVIQFPSLLDELLAPQKPIQEVLDTSFSLGKRIPAQYQLSEEDMITVIRLNLQAIEASNRLLAKITLRHEGERKSILRRGNFIVANHIYKTNGVTRKEKDESFLELLEFVLMTIMVKNPNQRGLEIAQLNFI